MNNYVAEILGGHGPPRPLPRTATAHSTASNPTHKQVSSQHVDTYSGSANQSLLLPEIAPETVSL